MFTFLSSILNKSIIQKNGFNTIDDLSISAENNNIKNMSTPRIDKDAIATIVINYRKNLADNAFDAREDNFYILKSLILSKEISTLNETKLMHDGLVLSKLNLNSANPQVTTSLPLAYAGLYFSSNHLEYSHEYLLNYFRTTKTTSQSDYNTYRFLFDTARLLNRKLDFELYSKKFSITFNCALPAWEIEADELYSETSNVNTIHLGENLDNSINDAYNKAAFLKKENTKINLDASNLIYLNASTGESCELLLKILDKKSIRSQAVNLIGITTLFTLLRKHILTRSRSTSQDVWNLYFAILEILDFKALHEDGQFIFETIYACKAPPWPELRRKPKHHSQEHLHSNNFSVTFTLTQQELTNIDEFITSIDFFRKSINKIVVDCSKTNYLGRAQAECLLDFLWLCAKQGITFDFKNLSNPMATLMIVMGFHHISLVNRRTSI